MKQWLTWESHQKQRTCDLKAFVNDPNTDEVTIWTGKTMAVFSYSEAKTICETLLKVMDRNQKELDCE